MANGSIKDINIKGKFIKVHVGLSKYGDRLERAQQWLGDKVLEDSLPFVPYRTGNLRANSYTTDGGRKVVFRAPYVGPLWRGYGSGVPGSREGVEQKEVRPLQYRTPGTRDHWTDYARTLYYEQWRQGVEDIVKGKK